MTKRIKISVDKDVCIRSTMCIHVAPQTFAQDDDGNTIVMDADGNDYEDILEAAEGCPVSAITIEEIDEK